MSDADHRAAQGDQEISRRAGDRGRRFRPAPGEIHALVGENGAGKSTLTKVMAGVVELTAGAMLIDGREVRPQTPPRRCHPASPWSSRRPAWCRR